MKRKSIAAVAYALGIFLMSASIAVAQSSNEKPNISELIPITKGEEIELYPNASKTDNRVIFESYRKNSEGKKVIIPIIMDASGNMEKVTSGTDDCTNPSWTMGDKGILFDSYPRKKRFIWRITFGKQGDQKISTEDTVDFDADSNPKNGRIAFAAKKDGKNAKMRRNGQRWYREFKKEMPFIYLINSDKSGYKLLIDGINPVWSPDGTRIAFASNISGDYEIYTIKPEPNNPVLIQLTNRPEKIDLEPTWSPDGRKIAFTSYSDKNWDIWMVNKDGSDLKRLTVDPGHDGGPSWGKDGSIYFHSDRLKNWDIWKMKPAGYEPIPDDTDKDGIPDDKDKCPEQSEDMDKFEDADGCPDPDNDNDGFADGDDKCPMEEETKNDFEEEDGCPDVNPLEKPTILYLEFDSSHKKIILTSIAMLEGFRDKLMETKSRVEIRAYLGKKRRGREEAYLERTQYRADAVRAYYIDRGIDSDRLVAVGYGSANPVASNSTSEGRGQNSRVEIVMIK
jgi:Tol biopolymer transport system component